MIDLGLGGKYHISINIQSDPHCSCFRLWCVVLMRECAHSCLLTRVSTHKHARSRICECLATRPVPGCSAEMRGKHSTSVRAPLEAFRRTQRACCAPPPKQKLTQVPHALPGPRFPEVQQTLSQSN